VKRVKRDEKKTGSGETGPERKLAPVNRPQTGRKKNLFRFGPTISAISGASLRLAPLVDHHLTAMTRTSVCHNPPSSSCGAGAP